MWYDYDGVAERFDSKTKRQGECIVWTGSKAGNGYGVFRVSRPARAQSYAHRLALERKLQRKLTPGERALHSCDNPPCVNSEHLRPGTQSENMRDASERGRTLRGENGTGTRLTFSEVTQIRALLEVPGVMQREIAARFGISTTTVSHIKSGKSWARQR